MARSLPLLRGIAVAATAGIVLAACGEGDNGAEPEAPAAPQIEVKEGDGVLTIGSLLPDTGSLAFLGPPMLAGVDLAVEDINEAGGVLGKDVVREHADSGDTESNIAGASTDSLLAQKADVILGAASSSVSLSVIDKIIGRDVAMISPANTSDQFTTYEDEGLYFRTAPPDKLQGRVLGDLVVSDGNAATCILALQDAYGTGLADNTETAIQDAGGEVVEKIIYDPKAAEFSAEVSQVKAAGCQGIVIIGFAESTKIFAELIKQGMPAPEFNWYLVDGNTNNYGDDLPEGTLEGAKATFPSAEVKPDFEERLTEINEDVRVTLYGPESYDAAILVALAAIAAGNDSGTAIASKLQEVSSGGEKCTTFADCKELLEEGTDIDYDGISGPIEFNEAGDPAEATIAINEFGADNNYEAIEYRSGKI
ncbi:MAG: ABC transporter substrate-binding protein [Haloechinothrix sp.]